MLKTQRVSACLRRSQHGSSLVERGVFALQIYRLSLQKSPCYHPSVHGPKSFNNHLSMLTDERLNNASNVIKLSHFSGKMIYVCGVSHHSHLSTVRVDSLLNDLWPDRIVLELCEQRLKQIRLEMALQSPWMNAIRFSMHRFFRYSLSIKHPHGPFIAAVQYAERRNVPIECGDVSSKQIVEKLKSALDGAQRQSHLEYNEENRKLSVISKMMQWCISYQNEDERLLIRERKTAERGREVSRQDARRSVSKFSPSVYRIIHDEREQFITKHIAECKGDVIVAIVGIGHLDGIETHWKQSQGL